MKKIITIIIICFAISFIFAEEPQSMRNIATDGVFSDAWEDVFDPIGLGSINKFYFFTNLSDFDMKYNDLYGDVSEDYETKFLEELPIGLAFTNPFLKKLKHSFFIRMRNNQTPENFGDGNNGDYEEYVTQYSDVTGDDIYDVRTMLYSQEQGKEKNDKLFDFIWNNNYQLKNLNIGLKYSGFSSTNELDNSQSDLGSYNFSGNQGINGFDYGDHQENMYKEYYNIGEEDYYYKYSEIGEFSTKIANNQKNFLLSIEKDNGFLFKDSSLRFDLGMDLTQNLSRDTNDEYHGTYEEIIVADTLINSGNISETYKRKIEREEVDLYFASTLSKEIKGFSNDENGFWETGINFGLISGEKEVSMQNHLIYEEKVDSLFSSDYTIIEATDNYNSTNENGDIAGVHFGTHFLVNLPLNNYSIFGFGGYYSYSNNCGNYDYVSERLNVSSYQIGSDIDTSSEFVQTETEFLSADKQTIVTFSGLRIPIALEFKIPDEHTSKNDGFGLRNFAFRVGSTFFLNSTKTENTYDVIEKNPNLIITEYGDGLINESHDPENELNSNKEIIEIVTSTKQFSAGIGYKHSNNLSIDLGGYYNCDSEDYYLGLSFTINR